MSFPFGRKPNLRDRTMGKSEDEIFDNMLKNIKQRKKEFFESPQKWRSTGMFDDELGSAGGSRFKAHLGDLAARHPELADHIFDLLPEESNTGTIPKGYRKGEVKQNTSEKSNTKEENHPKTTTTGTQTGGLESDIKLRSTVPDMQTSAGESVNDSDRGQRSQSAPPQSATSNKAQNDEGIKQIPIRTDSPSRMGQSGPQVPRPPNQNFQMPQQPHFQMHGHHNFQQPQQDHFPEHGRHEEGSKGPTVRHIPIFVEGRDEPLLPKDAGQTCGTRRGGCQGKSDQPERKQHSNHDQNQQQQQHHGQQQQQHHGQQQQPSQQHHSQPQPRAQQEHQQTRAPSPPPPPAPPQKPDPLNQVAEVMIEVEALSAKVSQWNGMSRTDKEYVYLDEMLTRNLLKLDNIDTEGKDEVRTARKEAIRRIQDAISVLESKADQNSQNKQQGNDDKANFYEDAELKNADNLNRNPSSESVCHKETTSSTTQT